MGKKKGKKKGKKGSKKGKPDLGDVGPNLSVPERFIKFQLDTRTDVMNIWQDRRTDMFEKNEQSRKRLTVLKEKQLKLIDMLRTKTTAADANYATKSSDAHQSVELLKIKNKSTEEAQNKEVVDLQAELAARDRDLAEETALLNLLEHHKNELTFQWDKQIAQLKQTVENLHRDYEQERTNIERQFSLAMRNFDEHVDDRLSGTKRDASDSALYRQPADDKIAYSDNGWLRHEIDEHQVELERAKVVVQGLRNENVRLVQTLLGPAYDQNAARRLRSAPMATSPRRRVSASPAVGPLSPIDPRAPSASPSGRPSSTRRRSPMSRPTSRERVASGKLRIKSHKGSVTLKSGHRAAQEIREEDLQDLRETPEVMMQSLRIFPTMAASNSLPKLRGAASKRGRSTSVLPKLPQATNPSPAREHPLVAAL